MFPFDVDKKRKREEKYREREIQREETKIADSEHLTADY